MNQLQGENSQLLSLRSKQVKDVEDVRILLNDTKAILAEKERSRRIRIYQSNEVQTSIGNIERCVSTEKVDRMAAEKKLREIKVKEEQLEIASLDEWLLQEDLQSKLSSLEVQLEHAKCDYEFEQRRQEELKKECNDYKKEMAQMECNIKGLQCQLNMEKTLLKAEESAETKWCMENQVSEKVVEKRLWQKEQLKQMIDGVKDQLKSIAEENDTLGSYIEEKKKAKLVSTKYTLHFSLIEIRNNN